MKHLFNCVALILSFLITFLSATSAEHSHNGNDKNVIIEHLNRVQKAELKLAEILMLLTNFDLNEAQSSAQNEVAKLNEKLELLLEQRPFQNTSYTKLYDLYNKERKKLEDSRIVNTTKKADIEKAQKAIDDFEIFMKRFAEVTPELMNATNYLNFYVHNLTQPSDMRCKALQLLHNFHDVSNLKEAENSVASFNNFKQDLARKPTTTTTTTTTTTPRPSPKPEIPKWKAAEINKTIEDWANMEFQTETSMKSEYDKQKKRLLRARIPQSRTESALARAEAALEEFKTFRAYYEYTVDEINSAVKKLKIYIKFQSDAAEKNKSKELIEFLKNSTNVFQGLYNLIYYHIFIREPPRAKYFKFIN